MSESTSALLELAISWLAVQDVTDHTQKLSFQIKLFRQPSNDHKYKFNSKHQYLLFAPILTILNHEGIHFLPRKQHICYEFGQMVSHLITTLTGCLTLAIDHRVIMIFLKQVYVNIS